MKRKTNFDKYLEEQLKDKDFAKRFEKAGKASPKVKLITIPKQNNPGNPGNQDDV